MYSVRSRRASREAPACVACAPSDFADLSAIGVRQMSAPQFSGGKSDRDEVDLNVAAPLAPVLGPERVSRQARGGGVVGAGESARARCGDLEQACRNLSRQPGASLCGPARSSRK